MFVKKKFSPLKAPFKVIRINAQCCGKENYRPYKCRGTNPRDDEKETCLTKSSMLVHANESFYFIYTLVHGTIVTCWYSFPPFLFSYPLLV